MKKSRLLFFTGLTLVGVLTLGNLNSQPTGAPARSS